MSLNRFPCYYQSYRQSWHQAKHSKTCVYILRKSAYRRTIAGRLTDEAPEDWSPLAFICFWISAYMTWWKLANISTFPNIVLTCAINGPMFHNSDWFVGTEKKKGGGGMLLVSVTLKRTFSCGMLSVSAPFFCLLKLTSWPHNSTQSGTGQSPKHCSFCERIKAANGEHHQTFGSSESNLWWFWGTFATRSPLTK